MDETRFSQIINDMAGMKVGVLGDFFLDLYLSMDRSLSELSLETNLEAFQVDQITAQPGAAGVVAKNLTSLGAEVSAFAVIGADGFGYELQKALKNNQINVDSVVTGDEVFTPTYIKPMMKEISGSVVELNRVDVKNRSALPLRLEEELIRSLRARIQDLDGLLVAEQVRQDGTGTITRNVRELLFELSNQYPEKIFGVDSRHFSAQYRGVFLKVNLKEACRTLESIKPGAVEKIPDSPLPAAQYCQQVLYQHYQKPVFITLGDQGISGQDAQGPFHHPGVQLEGPLDIVGAGDAVLAGICLVLSTGGSSSEAAYLGNLIGSLIVQQLGTTGIVDQKMLKERYLMYQQQ